MIKNNIFSIVNYVVVNTQLKSMVRILFVIYRNINSRF